MSDSTSPLVSHQQEINNIETTIVALESQRAALGDLVVDTALDLLRERLATLMQPDQASNERKRVTVLFADVSGYTALSENLDPEDVANIMNRLFEAVTVEIHRFGGTVDKYSGDAVMALFGAPQALENHEEMAVRASLAMQRVIGEFSDALEKERGFSVAMRIGLNTGPVLAGLVGGLKTRSYTVMGDTVNLSSRLEHAAPVGRILISATTAQPIQAIFDFEPPQQISVKGKSEPITVYLVNGERAERGRVRGLAGLYAPMVGREFEFLDLLDSYRDVVRTKSWQATAVMGDAGIGKSRIRREFVAWVAGTFPKTRVVTGTGYTHTRTTPYAFIIEQIRSLFGLSLDVARNAVVETAVTQISNELHNLQPDLDDTEFQYQLGSLASILGFTLPNNPLSALDPEQRRDRTFLSLERIYLAAASQAPMLLIIEDLHWADMLSMSFLERLLQMVARGLFQSRGGMILIISRPAEEPTSLLGKIQAELKNDHQIIDLPSLTDIQAEQLITELLDQELPPELTEIIIKQTQGNPFYVEEIIRSFIEDGVLRQDEITNAWQVTRAIADVEVPGSVQDIIAARLDRLPPGNKRITQHAAIIGRTFWQELLSHITEADTVEPTLSLLEVRQLADRLNQSQIAEDWEWMFRHILIQEVAYTTVPKTTRREVHKQVAETLEAELDSQTSFLLPLIGFHFEQGDVPDKAIFYLTQAGEQAASQFANEAAIGYFNRALIILDKLAEKDALLTVQQTQQYSLLLGRAEVYHLTGQREPQAADLARLQILADESGNDEQKAEVALKYAAYYQAISDFPTAVTYAKTAVTHADQATNMQMKAKGLNEWAFTLVRLGEFNKATEIFQQAQALARTHQDQANEATSLLRLGVVYYFQGNYKEAENYYRKALSISRIHRDLQRQSSCLLNLIAVFHALGDFAQAKTYGQEALTIAKTIGNRHNEARILNNLGVIYHTLGDLNAARNLHTEAFTLAQVLKDRLEESSASGNLSLVLHDLGEDSFAISFAESALAIDREIGDRLGQGYSLTALGKVQEGLGYYQKAISAHQEAIAIRKELGQDAYAIDNVAELAHISLQRNELQDARTYVEEVLIWIDTQGVDGLEYPLRMLTHCSEVLMAIDNEEKAEELLTVARNLLQDQASRISDEALRQSYLNDVLLHQQILK